MLFWLTQSTGVSWRQILQDAKQASLAIMASWLTTQGLERADRHGLISIRPGLNLSIVANVGCAGNVQGGSLYRDLRVEALREDEA